jgi:hypothetical protein
MNMGEMLALAMIGVAVIGIVGLFLAGFLSANKQAHRRKEMEHLERMKALEMGVNPQAVGLDWPGAAVCIAIGAGVPIGSFLVAWLAALTAPVPHAIWVAPVFVSLAAIGSARKLAYRFIDPRSKSKKPAYARSVPTGKPEFDPDAFDVVGSRG